MNLLPSQLQDDHVLRLQLADDAPDKPPLEACARLLHACSSCAFNLPRDSSTWDLTNLLIEGHPVSRNTVTAWLNVVHTHLEDKLFEEGEPAAAASATRLYQLLAFADAVGSSRGVVKACLAGLEQLAFEVKLGDIEVQLGAGALNGWAGQALYAAKQRGYMTDDPRPTADEQQKASFTQQVAAQLEPLLYLAYRLQLAPLQEVLQGFIRSNTPFASAILYGHMRHVLTPRVIGAASECDVGEAALRQLLVAQRGSLFGQGDGLFEAVDASLKPAPAMKFKAKIKKPLPGLTPGDVVDVELDLNECRLKVGGSSQKVQLVVGPLVDTAARMQAVLGADDPPSSKSPRVC